MVITVNKTVYKELTEILEKIGPDEAIQYRRPMTYYWILKRAFLSETVPLKEFEDAIKLQNHHLSMCQIITIGRIPSRVDLHKSHPSEDLIPSAFPLSRARSSTAQLRRKLHARIGLVST